MAILYFFVHLGPTMLHKKFQVISIKNEGVTAFFVISHFHKIYKIQKWVCMGISGYLWVCICWMYFLILIMSL